MTAGGETRVREAIAAGLLERYPEISEIRDASGKTPLDAIRSKDFDSFDFYLTDSGTVVIVFDKYEIAPGAAGMFSVELNPGCTRDLADNEKPLPLYTSLKMC